MNPDGVHLGTALHETPLGKVTSGIEFLDTLVNNYQTNIGTEDLTYLQGQIGQRGNEAAANFKLDRITACRMRDPKASKEL